MWCNGEGYQILKDLNTGLIFDHGVVKDKSACSVTVSECLL